MRVRLATDVDRYPHFLARAGATGRVVEECDELVRVRMDRHLPGAEEWNNEIVWAGDMRRDAHRELAPMRGRR